MEPTLSDRPAVRRLFHASLVVLPYVIYLSIVGLLGLLVMLVARFRRTALDPWVRNGFLGLTGLMVISSLLAENKGEAFLQLTNFLPFFALFSVLPFVLRRVDDLERAATLLVLTTIPLNLISVVEYSLKSPWLPASLRRLPWVRWVRSAPHKGRAMTVFDHPNVMASFLVLILGLGLGLVLKRLVQASLARRLDSQTRAVSPAPIHLTPWVVAATGLTLVGIFCTGSRNGLIVAVLQLVVFSLFTRRSRIIVGLGLLGVLGMVGVASLLGIGGRRLAIGEWADDPRVGVWRIALDLIRERPWWGWGLGNYKFEYPARLIDPEYQNIFHPHNFWLLLASEAGLLVMVGMTLLVGYICYRGIKSGRSPFLTPTDKAILLAYGLGFLGCVGYALFDVTLYDARINVLNWLLLSGLYRFGQIGDAKQPPESMPSVNP